MVHLSAIAIWESRLVLTRLVSFSYFWFGWKVTPTAEPSFLAKVLDGAHRLEVAADDDIGFRRAQSIRGVSFKVFSLPTYSIEGCCNCGAFRRNIAVGGIMYAENMARSSSIALSLIWTV